MQISAIGIPATKELLSIYSFNKHYGALWAVLVVERLFFIVAVFIIWRLGNKSLTTFFQTVHKDSLGPSRGKFKERNKDYLQMVLRQMDAESYIRLENLYRWVWRLFIIGLFLGAILLLYYPLREFGVYDKYGLQKYYIVNCRVGKVYYKDSVAQNKVSELTCSNYANVYLETFMPTVFKYNLEACKGKNIVLLVSPVTHKIVDMRGSCIILNK